MEECVNDEDYGEKEKIAENKNEGVIHRYIKKNEKWNNWDALEKVIE